MWAACCLTAQAQRMMEDLNRGLVAVQTEKGVFTSWRIHGTEYYDTQYNLYRDGKLVNPKPLDVSNFTDPEGTASSTYTVKAVVRGEEQDACLPIKVWSQQYLEIPMGKVYSRNGTDISNDYELNDVSAADLDGDGDYELIVKRTYNHDGLFEVSTDTAYTWFEAYKLDGTKLWSIDIGPNIVSMSHVETNIIAYDWDCDGKAEILMRAADGTVIHASDGTTTVIGDPAKNYRGKVVHATHYTYSVDGDEFLLYMEGTTGKLYNAPLTFPLKRLEEGETNIEAAWGDNYGHRANKFFFGAPYLDGRKPSIFLARGIYTREKMIAYDVDPKTHELKERWRWNHNTPFSPWYGQGYHNYSIADVDLDGRDEIVYGSMVIDDNGHGLSTTGLGHGDAQHCGDLDPYRKGLEIYACLEGAQGSNYRDATTSEIYYRTYYVNDCGRAMAGKFTEQYLGCQMVAPGTGLISSVVDKEVASGYTGITQNFRIYWDGDLCDESLDGIGNDGTLAIYKFGKSSAIFTAPKTKLCNYSKNTPCLQADLLGDWREELVVRTEDNQSLRIYTTINETSWRNYTLLHDMQYRQAIVWQMCGYNQPPHVSYFLGETEGYTVAPPPLMTNGRTEVEDAITTTHNGQHVLLADPEGGEVNVAEGASPYILTVNAFSHTEGHDNNDNITTSYSTYTLKGGTFGGDMRLVKQGEGILNLSGKQTYAGPTDLWGGTMNFTGQLPNSHVQMNRFTELNAEAIFDKGIQMEYGSILRPGGSNKIGQITVDSLNMRFGAIIEFDLYSDGLQSDKVILTERLLLESINRSDVPEYSSPVFRFIQHPNFGEKYIAAGKYCIADINEIDGDLSKVIIEGLDGIKYRLEHDNSHIYLVVTALRNATSVYWDGTQNNNIWDLANNINFNNAGEPDFFVTGDKVTFDDSAEGTSIILQEELEPSDVLFKNDHKTYSLTGLGSIKGSTGLTKRGNGSLGIGNINTYQGKTSLEGGITTITSLANSLTPYGSLGAYTEKQGQIEISNGAILRNTAAVTNGTPITIGTGGGTIQTEDYFTMQTAFDGGVLTKTGNGELSLVAGNNLKAVIVKEGSIRASQENVNFGDTLFFSGNSTYYDLESSDSWSINSNNFKIEEGVTAFLYLDGRCNYTGKLLGKGTAKINIPYIRTFLQGDWSEFEGTIEPINTGQTFSLDNAYGLPKATLNIPENVYIGNSGKTFTIGKVTGKGSLGGLCLNYTTGTNIWRIGALNEDFTFSAKIEAEGTAFEKIGTGKMTITGANPFTGHCTIQEGTICLNNRTETAPMLGTGILNVEKTATLCGQGTLGNPTVNIKNGAELRPGVREDASSGTLDFSNQSVYVESGGYLTFNISSSTRCTNFDHIHTLTMLGTLRINIREGLELQAGNEFKLWNATETIFTDPILLEADSPGRNLEWDTSNLNSGILRVKTGTGIKGIIGQDIVNCDIYTMDGAYLGNLTCTYDELNKRIKHLGMAPGIYNIKVSKGQQIIIHKKITIK